MIPRVRFLQALWAMHHLLTKYFIKGMVWKGFYSNLAQNTEYWRRKRKSNDLIHHQKWLGGEKHSLSSRLCGRSCKGIKLKPVNKHPPGEAPHPGLGPQPPDTGRSSARSCFTPSARSFGARGPSRVQQSVASWPKHGHFGATFPPVPTDAAGRAQGAKVGQAKRKG